MSEHARNQLQRVSRQKAVFSKQYISRLKSASSEYRVWDIKSQGLGIRVTKNSKTFFVAYRNPAGRWVRLSIGRFGDFSVELAREKAHIVRRDAANGLDPKRELEKIKEIPNLTQLCQRYINDGLSHKKPSTVATDKGRIKRHIIPLLGNLKVDQIMRADVQKFLKDVAEGKTAVRGVKSGVSRGKILVSGGKGTATRTVGLLGGIFQFAIDQGIISENPCRGVRRFKDKRMNRFLNDIELNALGEALLRAEEMGMNTKALAVIRLLVLTGARKGEIESLKWSEIDTRLKMLSLSDTKTGQSLRPLSTPAIQVLEDVPKRSDIYVFPAERGVGYYVGTSKIWRKIREIAELKDVRLHDLRHTTASVAVSGGASLAITGALLGHINPSTTQRYAHLSDNPIHEAAELVGSHIASALVGKTN